MASISAGLAQFLTDSGLVGERVYPLEVPKDQALPAITYQRIDTPRVRSHQGPSGLAHPRFQLTIQTPSFASMTEIATGLRKLLDGFVGMMGDVRVQSVSVVNETDFETESNFYFVDRMDVVIWHEE